MPLSDRKSLKGTRVLVVEDEYYLADDMRDVLTASGAEVVGPVPSREEAADLIGSAPIDVAIVDINLQGRMAYPVATALRKAGIPFVFTTGYGEDSFPAEFRDVPHWTKPLSVERLLDALPTLCRQT